MIAAAAVILTQTGFAQAPSGTITSMTYTGAQGLCDFTGVITDFKEDFITGPDSTATVSENIGLVQSITGAVTANGKTTTVTVDQVGGNNAGTFSFPGTYTLKGSVKTSKGNILGSVVFNGSGSATLNGVMHKFTESLTYTLTINPATGTLTGQKIGTITKSGANGGSAHLTDSTFTNSFPTFGWNLSLTVATSKTGKVTGSANVALANEGNFPFNVTGTYSARTGTKLTLTGTGTAKGATLTVTMTGNTITGISGSLFGQTVKLSSPAGL